MKNNYIIALLLAGLLAVPCQGICENKPSFVEQRESSGAINWTKGLIQAKGKQGPSEKVQGKSQEREEVIKTAKLAAMNNLLETAKQVRINRCSLVRDIFASGSPVMTRIKKMAAQAQLVKQEYLSDGTVEITMQMSLYGGFSQLVLPREVKQLESVRQTRVKKSSPSNTEKKSSTDLELKSEILSGLVVDARGLKLQPALCLKIINEDNQEVYGSAFASRDFAVQKGMAGYMKDIKTAETDQRVQKNPLTVKGLRMNSGNIVISNADASRLRSAFEHLLFLKECRVIVVID